MVVVGGASSSDSLVIQTELGDYSVDGFDSTTFSPYRLKTRASGGYLGAATSVDGDLVQFYADRRLLTFPSGVDLGMAIQDRLSSVRASLLSKVRLYWFAAESRNYLILSVPSNPSTSTANDYTYVFDLDRGGAVYEWNLGFSAFATVHNSSTGALELLAGTPAGAVYRLFSGNNQDAASNFTPTIKTGLIRFPEQASDISYVKIFVNDAQVTSTPTTAWTGRVFLNEQTNTGATDGTVRAITFRVGTYRERQSAQGLELVATFPPVGTRVRAKVFQLEITFPTANADLYIEKIIVGFKNAQATEAQT
jgi:hypothetical protein